VCVEKLLNGKIYDMTQINLELPKAPRWISTEAGLWAWQAHGGWRATAANALSVHERHQLLQEAEQLHGLACHAPEEVTS
jgi:hypothetical protein